MSAAFNQLAALGPLALRCWGLACIIPFGAVGFAVWGRLGFAGVSLCLLSPYGLVPLGEGRNLNMTEEFLVGLLLGVGTALLPALAAMVGELLDLGRGQQIGALYDPENGGSSAALSLLLRTLTWVALLAGGALPALMAALAESLVFVPLGSTHLLDFSRAGELLLLSLHRAFFQIFPALLPVLAVMLIIDLGSGLAGRSLGTVPLFSEAFVFKSALVFLILTRLLLNANSLDLSGMAQLFNNADGTGMLPLRALLE